MNKSGRFAVLSAAANFDCQARANAELKMCDKCVELDGKIEHYQRLSAGVTDQLTLDGIKKLIEGMKAQKAALHPEQST